MMMQFMKQDEINFINSQRAEIRLELIPVIAYAGEGKYIIVANQAERIKTENALFGATPQIKTDVNEIADEIAEDLSFKDEEEDLI